MPRTKEDVGVPVKVAGIVGGPMASGKAPLLPAAMRGHFPADAEGRLSTDAFPIVHPPI